MDKAIEKLEEIFWDKLWVRNVLTGIVLILVSHFLEHVAMNNIIAPETYIITMQYWVSVLLIFLLFIICTLFVYALYYSICFDERLDNTNLRKKGFDIFLFTVVLAVFFLDLNYAIGKIIFIMSVAIAVRATKRKKQI